MTYYPVIIPTLNRFQHFKECVESLAACTHADKTELVIGLDYPPSEKYVEGWKQIKEYIPTITGFAKVTVFENEHNLGTSGNSEFLINYTFNKYAAYIYTEDDNVFSPCFLDYMDKCLEKYRGDENVLFITGFQMPVNWNQSYYATVFRNQSLSAYGLGVWREKYKKLLCELPNNYKMYVCNNHKLLKRLYKSSPRDLYQLVVWPRNNPNLNGAVDFAISAYLNIYNKYTISPLLSLVRNNGYDGSGVNCGLDENSIFMNQEISKSSSFEIIDSMNEEERIRYRKEWEEFVRQPCVNDFSKEKLKYIRKYYYCTMIFGYTITEAIFTLNLRSVIKSKIKNVLKKKGR